jgi:hypothetical protein
MINAAPMPWPHASAHDPLDPLPGREVIEVVSAHERRRAVVSEQFDAPRFEVGVGQVGELHLAGPGQVLGRRRSCRMLIGSRLDDVNSPTNLEISRASLRSGSSDPHAASRSRTSTASSVSWK